MYGTFLHGRSQAALLGGLEQRPARVRASLYRMPSGTPALKLEGAGIVHGALVQPSERLLDVLDLYEGVGQGLFERVPVEVLLGLRTVAAQCYAMEDPAGRGGRRLDRGRWASVVRR